MASGSSDTQSTIAQKTWEMSNNIETISSVDEIYRYDRKQQQDILAAKPWEKEYVFITPHGFFAAYFLQLAYLFILTCKIKAIGPGLCLGNV